VRERMSWINYLRLGIIFTVTGLMALGHGAFSNTQATLIIGIVLVVVGLPLLVAGVRLRSRNGTPPILPNREGPDDDDGGE